MGAQKATDTLLNCAVLGNREELPESCALQDTLLAPCLLLIPLPDLHGLLQQLGVLQADVAGTLMGRQQVLPAARDPVRQAPFWGSMGVQNNDTHACSLHNSLHANGFALPDLPPLNRSKPN